MVGPWLSHGWHLQEPPINLSHVCVESDKKGQSETEARIEWPLPLLVVLALHSHRPGM